MSAELGFLLLLPVLAAAAISDLRALRIPNLLSLIGLGLFAVLAPFLPLDELAMRVLIAGLCFAMCFALFALNMVGGGDAKLLPVMLLFVPARDLSAFMLALSLGMMLSLAAVTALQARPSAAGSRYRGISARGRFPMALAFLLAGLGEAGLILSRLA